MVIAMAGDTPGAPDNAFLVILLIAVSGLHFPVAGLGLSLPISTFLIALASLGATLGLVALRNGEIPLLLLGRAALVASVLSLVLALDFPMFLFVVATMGLDLTTELDTLANVTAESVQENKAQRLLDALGVTETKLTKLVITNAEKSSLLTNTQNIVVADRELLDVPFGAESFNPNRAVLVDQALPISRSIDTSGLGQEESNLRTGEDTVDLAVEDTAVHLMPASDIGIGLDTELAIAVSTDRVNLIGTSHAANNGNNAALRNGNIHHVTIKTKNSGKIGSDSVSGSTLLLSANNLNMVTSLKIGVKNLGDGVTEFGALEVARLEEKLLDIGKLSGIKSGTIVQQILGPGRKTAVSSWSNPGARKGLKRLGIGKFLTVVESIEVNNGALAVLTKSTGSTAELDAKRNIININVKIDVRTSAEAELNHFTQRNINAVNAVSMGRNLNNGRASDGNNSGGTRAGDSARINGIARIPLARVGGNGNGPADADPVEQSNGSDGVLIARARTVTGNIDVDVIVAWLTSVGALGALVAVLQLLDEVTDVHLSAAPIITLGEIKMDSELAKISLELGLAALLAVAVSILGTNAAVELTGGEVNGSMSLVEKLIQARLPQETGVIANLVEGAENVEPVAVVNQNAHISTGINTSEAGLIHNNGRALGFLAADIDGDADHSSGGGIEFGIASGSSNNIGGQINGGGNLKKILGGDNVRNSTVSKDLDIEIAGGGDGKSSSTKTQIQAEEEIFALKSTNRDHLSAGNGEIVQINGRANHGIVESGGKKSVLDGIGVGASSDRERVDSDGHGTTNGDTAVFSGLPTANESDVGNIGNNGKTNGDCFWLTINIDSDGGSGCSSHDKFTDTLDANITVKAAGLAADLSGISGLASRNDLSGERAAILVVMLKNVSDEHQNSRLVLTHSLGNNLVLPVATSTINLATLGQNNHMGTASSNLDSLVSVAGLGRIDFANKGRTRSLGIFVGKNGTLIVEDIKNTIIRSSGLDDTTNEANGIPDILETRLNLVSDETGLIQSSARGHHS